MRPAVLWLIVPAVAAAQFSIEVPRATSTQAVLQIRGATSPCTIDLREGAPDGPLHPDVTASSDISRPDTITWRDGTRVVILGQQRSNLALAADTEYYGTVSGCGSASFQFRTRPPAAGAIMPAPLPVNPAKWHNADLPAIDWTPSGRDKWYVDPMTGVKLRLVNRPEDFSFADKTDRAFTHWAGASGWISPSTVLNGNTSAAQTSNTNPLFLYPAIIDPWVGTQMSIENLGLIVWGRCTSGSGADCDIEIGITYHPGEGFAGTPFTLRMPGGAMAKISGGSTHPYANGAFPTAYPQPLFAGWGDVRITHDMRYGPTQVTTTSITNGVITIASPSANVPGHIQRTLRPGHHVWVQGSGCTANEATDICTVAANTDAGSLTLAEANINSTGKLIRGLPWGIMVRKKTSTGTVQVGIRYRIAGANNSSTGTTAPICGSIEQTDADGVKGHPCAIPERGGPYYMLYFISNDGEIVRPIAGLGSSLAGGLLDQISFSPTQGNVFFAKSGTTIYRGTYTGNWKDSIWDTDAVRYIFNAGGDYAYFDEKIVWQPAISPNAGVQITNAYPSQVSAPYPAWTTSAFAGVSGDMAFLTRTINGGQDDGPCQVAAFNLLTGRLVDFFNTLELDGPVAFGNCHSTGANALVNNTLKLDFNIMKVNNTGKLHGGPYRVQIEAVQRGGSWSANSCLEWPAGTGTQCAGTPAYDKACPADLSSEYTSFGANGNQCVTLLMSGHPCNIAPAAGDTTVYGACSWNASYSAGPQLRQGHQFVDTVTGGPAPGDAEHFRVLTIEDAGGGKLKVVAQRNASRDYCCAAVGTVSPAGSNCVCHNGQMTHTTGWTGLMVPGSKASCNAASIHVTYVNSSSPAKTFTELSRSFQGHTSYGRGPDGTLRYLGAGVITVEKFSDLGKQPPVKLKPVTVRFDGVTAPIGTLYQQYLNHSQSAAGNDKTVFSFDANAVNPAVGIGGNNMGNAVATRALARVSGDIWKLSAVDTVNYKIRPLLGWAGPKVLKEVSGPSSDIGTAADFSFCYAYKAGECRTGSSQGEIYTKVPKTFRHSGWQGDWCQTGMEFANIPCVLSAAPAAGYIRQFRSDRTDVTGADQRLLTSALRPYGTHYPFWGVTAHPAGQVAFMTSGGILEGIRHVVLLAKLPRWQEFPGRNSPGGVTIRIGPRNGMTHARVRFGYNTLFHCTERSDACLTDASLSPFAFEQSDTLTATSCPSGCSITVPAMPGRLLYYRVETFDGSAWMSGDTQTEVP